MNGTADSTDSSHSQLVPYNHTMSIIHNLDGVTRFSLEREASHFQLAKGIGETGREIQEAGRPIVVDVALQLMEFEHNCYTKE